MVEKFRVEVVDSSSDEKSDQSTHTLATTAASMIHEFTSYPRPVHRGSVKGLSKNLPRNRVEGQIRLHNDYFHLTNPVFPEKLPVQDVKGHVHGHSTGRQKLRPLLPMQARCNRLMQGKTPRVSYEVNGNAYDKPYYLADGIYPDWAALVKTIRNPNSEKTRRFAKMQEACKKDVKRGFGVLQARWAIVRHPARTWSLKTMHEVMTCCVIMHNMIVENERPDGRNENHWEFQDELVALLPGALSWEDYLHMNVEVTDENVCKQLQTDLIEHQWTLDGHEDHA
ncbi:hypothetical protein QYE76_043218 [Lolium multiflorum]|uniref:Uncharacterized protein n=1 Tax=Lolium multiflorum TaxID=4521 RepID=A0AAD8TG80_LOLMU|nr:hypothetical protein QYE76_043218 [Lolium multiflorum]